MLWGEAGFWEFYWPRPRAPPSGRTPECLGAKYSRLLDPHTSSRRSSPVVPAKTVAAPMLTRLGRRLWKGLEACAPFLNEKPSLSVGDCLGPVENKQTGEGDPLRLRDLPRIHGALMSYVIRVENAKRRSQI